METSPSIGRAVRRARVWREMSQRALGEACGVSEQTVMMWEHDRRVPSLAMLGPLCDALGVDAEYWRLAPVEDVDRLLR